MTYYGANVLPSGRRSTSRLSYLSVFYRFRYLLSPHCAEVWFYLLVEFPPPIK
jgi:hypothetical protein